MTAEEELQLEARDILEMRFCPTQQDGAVLFQGIDIRTLPRRDLISIIKILGGQLGCVNHHFPRSEPTEQSNRNR